MNACALCVAAGTASVSATSKPWLQNTVAQARPIRPEPTIAILVMPHPSKPEHLAAQFEILAQRLRGADMRHLAALQRDRPVRQRQRQIEMVIDDDDRDVLRNRSKASNSSSVTAGDRPSNGSSSSSTRVSPDSARATATICCSPPER
jgi:hypothetical protein